MNSTPAPSPSSSSASVGAGIFYRAVWRWHFFAGLFVAPFAVFGMGLILRRHALAKRRQGEPSGRRTGTLMLWLFLPLALTGYLIQVFVETGSVRATGWLHAGLGLLFLLGYALHPKRRAAAGNNGDD